MVYNADAPRSTQFGRPLEGLDQLSLPAHDGAVRLVGPEPTRLRSYVYVHLRPASSSTEVLATVLTLAPLLLIGTTETHLWQGTPLYVSKFNPSADALLAELNALPCFGQLQVTAK